MDLAKSWEGEYREGFLEGKTLLVNFIMNM
jgi:hypothetical protein